MNGFLAAAAVTKRYGAVTALRGVDLSVPRGSFVLLLGPNGAGKSTMLGILAGRIRPTSGTVTLDGKELRGDAGARSHTGLVAHSSFLYPGLTARENLMLYAHLYRLPDPPRRVVEVLEQVGMAEHADELLGGFSRGMTQRASIARSLLHDPDLLIWDEPFSGLDLLIAASLRELLLSLKQRGRTILLATHELGPAAGLPDQVVVLARGSVRHRGPAVEDLSTLYLSVMGSAAAGARA